MRSYRVQVLPGEDGYTLEVSGLRSFLVLDGYDGTLDDVARTLIADEIGAEPDGVRVTLHYEAMPRFRGRARFSWPVALAGVVTLAVVIGCIATSHPVAAAIGALVGAVIMRYQFATGGPNEPRPDGETPRIE